ncbi:hypothetical protein [Brevibacillus borstelensis]|uniref:hypothetical protein n=1 Tax=Brevibacillus borstelensis TaxID=45462 RepID=UPI0030C61C42
MFGRKWRFMLAAIFLFFLAWILNARFPHEQQLVDYLFQAIGVPAWSNGTSGMHYAAFLQLGLMALAYGLMVNVTNRPGVMLLVLLLAVGLLPKQQELVRWYQRTLADGIYTLEYREERSRCTAKTSAEGVINGSCEVVLKNHGDKPVQFEISVYGPSGQKRAPVLSGYPVEVKSQENVRLELPVEQGGQGDVVYEEWSAPRISISSAGKRRDL